MRSNLWWLLAGMALAGLFLAACGSNIQGAPSVIVCDKLTQASYRYKANWQMSVDELTTTLPPSVQAQVAFTFTGDDQGNVQDGSKIDITYTNSDGKATGTFRTIRLSPTLAYIDLGNGLQKSDTAPNRPVPIPYEPSVLCNSIAPDIKLASLGSGQPESVNGIASHRYDFDGLVTEFFARSPMFGAQSDLAANVPSLSGSVWVADDGGYISKLKILGQGPYESGQFIRLEATYEAYDMDKNVTVSAPG